MPRRCQLCLEKRDFMEVYPPRTQADFYTSYDPWVGITTAIILAMFFFAIVVKSCIRYIVRKWRMHQFYKRNPPGDTTVEECNTPEIA